MTSEMASEVRPFVAELVTPFKVRVKCPKKESFFSTMATPDNKRKKETLKINVKSNQIEGLGKSAPPLLFKRISNFSLIVQYYFLTFLFRKKNPTYFFFEVAKTEVFVFISS